MLRGILLNSAGHTRRTTAKRDRQMLYFNRGVLENGNIWRVAVCESVCVASWLLLLLLFASFRNLARELDDIYSKMARYQELDRILGFRNRVFARYDFNFGHLPKVWSDGTRMLGVFGQYSPLSPSSTWLGPASVPTPLFTKANGENRPIYGRRFA